MENQTAATINPMSNEIFIKMVISAWETYISRVNKLWDSLSEEELLSETAPGRNRGIYILGHLTAVTDTMLPLLGFGERVYPQLDAFFVDIADQLNPEMPSLNELKNYWKDVNKKLTDSINNMQPAEWFTRHNAVSADDFSKEPHRNKLNIIINRTNHMSYHLGQLIYLSKRAEQG